jgi:heme exporter protein A
MTLFVENLTVKRGWREIIAGLSFSVAVGEALVLTGANGAGKTTLLRTIAGLLAPETGVIRLDSVAGGPDREVGEMCHLLGHLNAIKSSLTVAENARFWAIYLGGPLDDVPAALDRFQLAELAAVPAGYLSAGQRRRLGLARLLVAPRPVWLLDEPAVSLDTASRKLLAHAIDLHVKGGGLVLAATHQPLGLDGARELRLGHREAQP